MEKAYRRLDGRSSSSSFHHSCVSNNSFEKPGKPFRSRVLKNMSFLWKLQVEFDVCYYMWYGTDRWLRIIS
ncbi:hypothetical protein KY285_017863 [Solanum tuberosum]|nr:hypothetical protein KY285_017863 [Solanum tuberosum]